MLEAFYGPQGVMAEASSHKAARLLRGKTMHGANNLHGCSSARAVHLRRGEARAKGLDIMCCKLGAKVIDELSRINAQLSRADAYNPTIAKAPCIEAGAITLCPNA